MKKLARTMGDGQMNYSDKSSPNQFKIDFSKFVKFQQPRNNLNKIDFDILQQQQKEKNKIKNLYVPSPKAEVIRET